MADRRVAIRLGTEGKAQVVADLNEIGTTGDAAFNRARRQAVKLGEDAEAAVQRANASMAKLQVLMPGLNPAKLDMFAGVQEGIRKSAETSGSVFTAYYKQMEDRARALVLAIDPVARAQDRFNREIEEARTLVSAGVLSLDEYVAKLRFEQQALDGTVAAHGRVGASVGAQRAGFQQLGFQLNDIAVQYASGTNATVIFAQQSGQVVQALQMISGEAKGLLGFLGGPWGIALSTAAIVLAPFVGKLLDGGDAAKHAKEATEDLARSVGSIGSYFDSATGKILQTNKALVQYAVLSRQRRIDELRDQQRAAQDTGNAALRESTARRFTGGGIYTPGGGYTGRIDPGPADIAQVFKDRRDIDTRLRAIATGGSSNAALAGKILEQRAQFARSAQEIAKTDKEVQSLLSGVLDPTLRTGGRAAGGGSGRSGAARSGRAPAAAAVEAFKLRDFDYADLYDPLKIAEAADRASAEAARRAKIILGSDTGPLSGPDELHDQWKEQHDAADKAIADEARKREQGIRTAANLYRDLMTGGVNTIWQRFQSYGLDVISQLLAKWTFGQLAGKGGSLVDGLKSILGVVPIAGKTESFTLDPRLTSRFAAGTEYFSGGAAMVGENGPEVVSMPQGSRVTTAAETRRLLGANDNSRGDTHIHVYAEGAVLAETVRGWVAEGVEVAAVRGAAGGASISEAQSTGRRTRKLGRY